MNNKKPHQLTVFVPVYNEEDAIPLFFPRFDEVVRKIANTYIVNLVFVNNKSTDKTYELIKNLSEKHSYVYYITISKNVGYQRSLECAIKICESDIYVFLDVDCEDPPEMIIDFLDYYEKGFDVVYGERVDREENYIVKKLRNIFYMIANKMADEDVVLYMAEFSLFSKEVRDAVLVSRNSFPFIRSSIARVGFNRIGLPYKRSIRIAGSTNYNLTSMLVFAVSGILSSSTLMLRLPIYTLPIWAFTSTYALFIYEKAGDWIYLFFVFFLSFVYFGLTISFIAIYIARIYKNSLGYPNAFIQANQSYIPSDLQK